MESLAEKECSALGGLFQYIISDLKVASPAWEDFLGKASKLHTHLKSTIIALTAFLDSFQKIADMATNARGATKDIGTALTRLCLRHRSVETKLKTFSSTLVDHLVLPLQERLEDWKKTAFQMDKDHAKEYKRVRQDIKKKSSDTLRLQKKIRKAPKGDAKKTLDSAIRDVNDKYHLLEETEKQAVRRALIEERGRYCLFVNCLRNVVESELATMHEVSHLQEVLDALTKLTEDPHLLPLASEQVIADVKSSEAGWSFRTPPSSPTSVGSRKSSTCSISSLNSSSSDSTHSPSHNRSRSLSQPPAGAFRLTSVSSQDSGFTSQDTLFTRLPTPPPLELTDQVTESIRSEAAGAQQASPSPSFPGAPCAMATWPNLQDTLQFEKAAASIVKSQRPHTISSAYERHNRPAITSHTFRPLQPDDGSDFNSGTYLDDCHSLEFPPPEEFPEDCSEEATPTHKIYPPPLPLRAEEMEMSPPKIPIKPQLVQQHLFKSTSSIKSDGLGNNPIYVNIGDILSASSKSNFTSPNNQEILHKTLFQKSLAATLAQNVLQQKQLKENALQHTAITPDDSNATISQHPPKIVPSQGSWGIPPSDTEGTPVVKAPPPPVRRSSSSREAPIVPPHKARPPIAKSPKGGETSWNVFNESEESNSAHAQLMRALNARLDALQKESDAEEMCPVDSLPPPPPPHSEDSGVTPSSLEFSPSAHLAAIQVARKSSSRAATASFGKEPDASRLDLESKISFVERRDKGSSSASNSKFNTAPRLGEAKAQRRVSQPTFSELVDQFPRNRPNVSGDDIRTRRVPTNVDRRSSLDLERDRRIPGKLVHLGSESLSSNQSIRQKLGDSNDAAIRVHNWLAGRGSVDMSQCRASLLGEIREGVNLRRASSDDRSAPVLRSVKVRHPK